MIRHQVKSRWYYIFWGIIAVAVCSGQVYVGLSDRILARDLRAFAQAIYDTQMGGGDPPRSPSHRKPNHTFEFE